MKTPRITALRVVGFENGGHDVGLPFNFWFRFCFWFEDTKKPGRGGAGLVRVGEVILYFFRPPRSSAGGSSATTLVVLGGGGQTFVARAGSPEPSSGHVQLGVVVGPLNQFAIEPGRVVTGVRHRVISFG